ncbi:conserved hypothetical protein [Vibrio phage 217E38-1]|nr:conserved hypothetical protein [Vibrio phage 217E38-1]
MIKVIKYSPKNHACYDDRLNYASLPNDLVDISSDEHAYFISSEREGKCLVRNKYPFEWESAPEPTIEQLSITAQAEMINELNWCDLQIKLHQSSDSRAVATLEDIFAYARHCRDYVRNLDGVLTIVGDMPSRPE